MADDAASIQALPPTPDSLVAPELSAALATLVAADEADVARVLVAQAAQLVAADQVRLGLLDSDPDWWVLAQAVGTRADCLGERYPRTAGVIGHVIAAGEAVCAPDWPTHTLAAGDFEPDAWASMVVVPLRMQREVLGALQAARARGAPPLGASHAAALQVLGDLAAARLGGSPQLQALRARAQDLAVMDPVWRPPPQQAGDFVVISPGVNGRDSPFLDVDAAACRALGYPREALLQCAVRDIIPLPPGADRADTLAAVRDQMNRGVPITYDTIVRRRDGSLIPVRFTIQRVDIPSGFVFRGIFSDLSNEKEAQLRALETAKQRLLGEISSSLSHELNTPLAVILGNLEMVLADAPGAEVEELLLPVRTAAQRIADTVKKLGGFTKVTGRAGWVPVDLSELAEDVAEQTRPLWDEACARTGHAIDLRLETTPVQPVHGNPVDLREAIRELIANAVQALPAGGTIVVATAQERQSVLVSVRDTGIGMSDHVRQRCVDPFFTTRRPSAIGLGLNRVYHTVLEHHGQLQIESAEGKGSCFTILLPLMVPDEARVN